MKVKLGSPAKQTTQPTFNEARGVAASVLGIAFVTLLVSGDAQAACTPAAANGVTATCTGTTINQGGGGGLIAGYGTGVETGVTVNVASGAANQVIGDNVGIYLGDATVTNNAAATIGGQFIGIYAATGFANVVNSGSIAGPGQWGILAATNATVINTASGTITGGISASGFSGIQANGGFVDVTNFGSITGFRYGVLANGGFAKVINLGSIVGTQVGIRATSGGSSIFNAGTIGGGTAIQFSGAGNTLTLAQGSVITGDVLGTGSDTFQLGGAGAATFDVATIGTAVQYQGFGAFNKVDSSNWTLTGTSTFAGPINVNGGTLSVNGDITSAGSLTVNPGGTLGGNGIVGTTAINGGTLAPGNSIGTLTVSGSLTMTAASTYLVQVSGTTSDRTNVTGLATISGKVIVDPLRPLGVTTTYTILNAGTRTGTFDSVSIDNFFARNARLSYVGNDVLLTLDPGLLGPILPGSAGTNQRSVAGAIDNAIIGGAVLPSGFNALYLLSGNELLNRLLQASGETATGAQQTSFDAMTQFMGVMTDPFTAGRGAPESAAVGYADETLAYAAKRSPSDALAAIYRKAPLIVPALQERWNVWAAAFGGSRNTDGNTVVGSNDTRSSIGGVAVGADYWFSPNTLAGFSLAGGGTNFSVANNGSGRSDLFQAGAFVRHTVGSAYITAAAAYGWQDITTDRVVGGDRLRAQFNANSYSGRIEGGNRYLMSRLGGIGLTPYAAAQVTALDLPSYAETAGGGANTFALAYAGKTVTSTRSELGFRTDKSFAVTDAILTLRGRLAWAHDFNSDRFASATFQTLPGASFVVNGAAQASDAALTTASAEMKWTNGWAVAGTFEGEFSDVTRSYAGKGVMRYAW